MSMRNFTISIAGFGLVGQRRYFYLKKKKVNVVAISDRYYPYRKKFKNKTYENFSDMLKLSKTDIVFICLPNKYAVPATIAALKNGSHVFCEKPPARNLKEMRSLAKHVKKNKKQVLMYGFNHRYHNSILKAKTIIDKKIFGKIINFRGIYGKSYITPKLKGPIAKQKYFSWREQKEESGGGILLDQGIHMLDMLNFFSGNFIEAKSFISNSFWKKNVEDNVYAILKNKNGIYATFNSSATLWKHKFLLDINLEKAIITLSGILSGTKSYGEEKIIIIKKKNNIVQERIEKFTADESWEKEINYFFKVIKSRERRKYSCGYTDALETMKLINLIYNAS